MTREIIRPTVDQHDVDTHPAFGQISASRMSSSPGQVLFDSDVRHGHTIRITVQRVTRRRDLNRDWIHPGREQLIEVELSLAQWASFVSSMNATGVPCTIRATESDHQVPGLPYDPRLAHSMDEVKQSAAETFSEIREARDAYEKALADKAPAKERNAKLRALHFAIENAPANLSFAAKSLSEHAENVVQRARADIEAMVNTEVTRLGLPNGESKGLLELPAFSTHTEERAS